MKHFVFTRTEGRTPRDGSGTKYTVRLYQIVRNEPRFLCQSTDSFVGDFQQVMELLEAKKLLPKAAFERNQFGGHRYCYGNLLRAAGFASVTQIT